MDCANPSCATVVDFRSVRLIIHWLRCLDRDIPNHCETNKKNVVIHLSGILVVENCVKIKRNVT